MEKRVEREIPGRLVGKNGMGVVERVVTVNVSPHGARVEAQKRWPRGEEVEFGVLPGNVVLRGRIVYCETLENGRFGVGVEFRSAPIPWDSFTSWK